MRKLDQYLVREFTRVFSLALSGSISLYLVVDFFERVNMLFKYEAGFLNSLYFFFYKIPVIITQVAPVALLLAVVISLGALNRRDEINAIRCSGINDWHIFRPYIGIGVIVSLLLLLFSEIVLPLANSKMEYIKNVEIKKRNLGKFRGKEIWYRDGNAIYHIESISPDRKHLSGIHIWFLSPKFQIQKRVDSFQARWQGNRWESDTVIIRSRSPVSSNPYKTRVEPAAVLPLPQAPSDFSLVIQNPEEMTFFELKNHIQKLKEKGLEHQHLLVDLYAKISIPFLALIVIFLGTPLGLRFGKRGGIMLGIFISLVTGFAFWTVMALGFSLGHAGVIPPILGAWISHIIFTALGLFLVRNKTP